MKDEIKSEIDLLIQGEARKHRLQLEADRPFTKNLFGLWLLLVVLLLVFGIIVIGDDEKTVFLIALIFWRVIMTGAATFQEVGRLHKRIDAIRKLEEKNHQTKN
jgi:hypothetical protein